MSFSIFPICSNRQFYSVLQDTTDCFSAPLFYQLIILVAFISCNLVVLDNGLHSITFDIVLGINCLLVQFIVDYLLCYNANNVTTQASELGQRAYDLKWYELSRTEQLAVQMIIERAQIPFYFLGLKFVTCTMQTYLTVRVFFSLQNHFVYFENDHYFLLFRW